MSPLYDLPQESGAALDVAADAYWYVTTAILVVELAVCGLAYFLAWRRRLYHNTKTGVLDQDPVLFASIGAPVLFLFDFDVFGILAFVASLVLLGMKARARRLSGDMAGLDDEFPEPEPEPEPIPTREPARQPEPTAAPESSPIVEADAEVARAARGAAAGVEMRIYDQDHSPLATRDGRQIERRALSAYVAWASLMQWTTLALALPLAVAVVCSLSASQHWSTSVLLGVFIVPFCGVLVLITLPAAFMLSPRRAVANAVIDGWRWLEVAWFGAAVAYLAIMGLLVGIRGSDGLAAGCRQWSVVIAWLTLGVFLVRFGFAISLGRRLRAASPLRLAVLWVFDEKPETLRMGMVQMLRWLRDDWRFVGSARFLRGPGMLFAGVREVLGARFQRVIRDRAQVRDSVARLDDRPRGVYCPGGWRAYPVHSVFCSDETWRDVLQSFVTDAHVVLMDLRGFDEDCLGCRHEIGVLVDRVPLETVLFVIDGAVDLDLLQETLATAWGQVAAGSPNRGEPAGVFRLYCVGGGQVSRVDLKAVLDDNDDARFLNVMLCDAAAAAQRRRVPPPIAR